MEEKIKLYKRACENYYQSGVSIMTDWEFDRLQDEIKESGLYDSILDEVEPETKKVKLQGDSGMISLSKTQIFTDEMNTSDIEEILNFFKNYDENISPHTTVIVAWKWDGVAIRLDYEKGKLVEIRTRGNFSVLNKFREFFPQQLNNDYTGEVRCECVMKLSTFNERYSSNYQNPRNLVSGIINDENINDERKYDVNFILLNIGTKVFDEEMWVNGFQDYTRCIFRPYILTSIEQLDSVFKINKEMRSKVDYYTDGLVVTLYDVDEFKGTGKFPYYARAIKFPPEKRFSTVTDISWKLSKLGEWIPTLIIEPVDIDGSTVRRVSAYNYGWIVANMCYPGAKVEVAKNGDIIPCIQQIVESGDINKFVEPKCGYIDGIHYMVLNEDMIKQEIFISACESLEIKYVSRKTYKKIGTIFNWNILNLFMNPELVNNVLSGESMSRKIIEGINIHKESMNTYKILRMMMLPNVGETTCREISKWLDNMDWSSFGLEKDIVKKFETDNEYYNKYIKYKNSLNKSGCKFEENYIREMNNSDKSIILYMMTGSPGEYGTKKEFSTLIRDWMECKKFTELDYLITDNINSNSSKMKKAKLLNIKIITYKQALEIYK